MKQNDLQFYRTLFEKRCHDLPGASVPWLHNIRKDALEEFIAEGGLPDSRSEEWMYLDMSGVGNLLRKLTDTYGAGKKEMKEEPLYEDQLHLYHFCMNDCSEQRLVFVNGRFEPDLSDLSPLPDGVHLWTLAEALQDDPSLAEKLFKEEKQIRHFQKNRMVLLNHAFFTDGLFLKVDDGVVPEKPIHLLNMGTADETFFHPLFCFIELGLHASVNLVEQNASDAYATGFQHAVSRIHLHEGATLEHTFLARSSSSMHVFSGSWVQQEKSSSYRSFSACKGGALIRRESHISLNGAGSECLLNGIYRTREKECVNYHTEVLHHQPAGKSSQDFKGTATGESRFIFQGNVIVDEGATESEASQVNKNLLLSAGAEVYSRPQLEIYNDDVQCSHGSGTGTVQADALHYLQNRGLSLSEAEEVLSGGFLSELIQQLPLSSLQQHITRMMELPDFNTGG